MGDPEETLATAWMVICLFGGLVCLVVGAHAAGLALLGALAGAWVGFAVVSFDLDAAPLGMAAGATIAAVATGLAGLAWKPRAPRRVLVGLAMAAVLSGVATAVYVWAGGPGACHARRCRVPYPHARSWGIALFVLDAVWVAFLCFAQAEQRRRAREERAPA